RHDGATEPAGQLLEPRREIDGGADAGEIEPVAAADIAVENLADMQRDAETEALDVVAELVLHRLDAGAGFARGFEHVAADLLLVADIFVDRKHREQPVAHIFQDFATMVADRRDLAVKILIENIDHGLGRQPVRQRGKPAQVGQPDRGVHRLGMAAANLTGHDFFAGAIADIGIEQYRGGAAQADDLGVPRQRRDYQAERIELLIGKATRLFRGPARGVNGTIVDERHRQRDVVGNALRAQLLDDREAPGFRIVRAGADLN